MRADTATQSFSDSLEVVARFDELGVPEDKRVYYFYEKDGRGGHWEGSYVTGGYMAVGILGQTIHVLPQYNAVIVCLSESNSSENVIVEIFKAFPNLSWSDVRKKESEKADNADENDSTEDSGD